MNNTKATSAETDQNPSFEENNSTVPTNSNQIQGDDLAYYSPDDDYSDSEESKAITIKLSILSLKKMYEEIHEFPDPKYMFDLKTKGLTTPEMFVAWWNENHQDFQITVDSIKKWTYREDEDHSRHNIHWSEYGD
ncbi:8088_t:CDS:2 [Acaulospora morrowiae]|uniref:8088_t:CDS:1 n=1 Tax=Acaulospora morrowiae TaxID=94023 RepID=A0A9N9CA02_9GLOM|nr:8088_t:CDS:2 [Acaulospora morrowiae]